MRKICAKFVPRVVREDQKERRCHDSREMVELINSDPTVTVLDALVTYDETFDYPFLDSTGMIYMHWVPTGQTANKEDYVEVLREFRKRFCRKRLALFKLGQWHFHQDNAPVHNSILVTDYLTKMGIKTVPYPSYSPDTRGLPWGLAEVVGTVQQVHCSRRRLLRRGLEFHVCTTNKSPHAKKVWKLI